jgi:hypothetical protein
VCSFLLEVVYSGNANVFLPKKQDKKTQTGARKKKDSILLLLFSRRLRLCVFLFQLNFCLAHSSPSNAFSAHATRQGSPVCGRFRCLPTCSHLTFEMYTSNYGYIDGFFTSIPPVNHFKLTKLVRFTGYLTILYDTFQGP